MATDLERLVVSLEASFTKYERAWQRAQGITDANTKQVAAKFDAATSRIGISTGNALRPVGVQTANIAAQFQDIAVQLQSGQSPFTIALQQGTQLSAALGATGGGLRGALKGLVAGFGSLVNPVSLATIAVITLGGAAVQYFTGLANEGKVSAETLKQQEDLIRKVADRWGDAVPALRAYVDQLDRAQEVSDQLEASSLAVSRAFDPARQQVQSLAADFADAIARLQAIGGQETVINELQAAFASLDAKVRDHTATADDARAVQELLANAFRTVSVPALQTMAIAFGNLARSIQTATQQASLFRQESQGLQQVDAGDIYRDRQAAVAGFVREQERLNSLTAEQLALETEIGRVKSEAERGKVVLTEQQALQIAQQRLAAEERRATIKADTKSGVKAASEAQREHEAVLQLIADLEHEYDLLGLTADQKEVANALRRAGAAATAEERAQIVQLITATQAQQQALDQIAAAYDTVRDTAKTALSTFIGDIRQGKSATDALADSLSKVGDKLLDIALNSALDAIFPGAGGGGGGLGSLFAGLFGGKRAAGGPVSPGKAYLVGEKRPELFVPSSPGMIVPRVPSTAAAASPASVAISISVDESGNIVPLVQQVAGNVAVQLVGPVARTQQAMARRSNGARYGGAGG